MTSYDKTNIPLVTALELSVAIHDRYGFTSKSTQDRATASGKESNLDAKGNPIPNSARLYRQLFPTAKVGESEREKFEITPEHVEMACEIRETLQGFSFRAIERELTNFEQQLLSVVNSDTITHKDLGRIASFPNVYERKISQDAWEERESELARNSEFVGHALARAEFDVVIENVRYLSRTESYLICASESGKNIIKFFVPERKVDNLTEGDTIKLTGYIKKQEVSKYHGGSETVINRVKFI